MPQLASLTVDLCRCFDLETIPALFHYVRFLFHWESSVVTVPHFVEVRRSKGSRHFFIFVRQRQAFQLAVW
jgi:hypothetical protein